MADRPFDASRGWGFLAPREGWQRMLETARLFVGDHPDMAILAAASASEAFFRRCIALVIHQIGDEAAREALITLNAKSSIDDARAIWSALTGTSIQDDFKIDGRPAWSDFQQKVMKKRHRVIHDAQEASIEEAREALALSEALFAYIRDVLKPRLDYPHPWTW